jgi:mannitol 2-dehydrogenase
VKLSQAGLARIGPGVTVPTYDRRAVAPGIVHIGVGGFHRSHEAAYCDELLQVGDSRDWGICGIGILPHDRKMGEVLREQDFLYTLVERESGSDRARVVGSILNFVAASDDPQRAIEALAAESTRIVSLTVTEGGYYLAADGGFDARHPDIVRELQTPAPRSTFGFLAAALDRRRRSGLEPFTVLSCDNIQGNGDVARQTLTGFAQLRDPELALWISRNTAFPNSMVDRITPATTDADRQMVETQFGVQDGWPVMCEPFRQWVIEDEFVSGRPAWERVGVQVTSDVLPYETMKLRLLNGSHQALCYIGMLLGYEFVHEAMGDADIRAFVRNFMEREVAPTLQPVAGVNLADYQSTLVARFANTAIRDQLSRVGIYGSSGMPKFVLPTVADQLSKAREVRLLAFVIATWIRYLEGRDESGKPISFRDPAAPELSRLAKADGPAAILTVRDIFSRALVAAGPFRTAIVEWLDLFRSVGAREGLRRAIT